MEAASRLATGVCIIGGKLPSFGKFRISMRWHPTSLRIIGTSLAHPIDSMRNAGSLPATGTVAEPSRAHHEILSLCRGCANDIRLEIAACGLTLIKGARLQARQTVGN